METLSWLCLFLPLAGVVVLALAGNRIGREPASWLATAIAFASFICAAAVFFSILGEGESARSHVYTLYTWAGAHNTHVLNVPLSIQVDQLSVELMLNSCNLTLIAFSRYWGDHSGQVFALIVMGIAASEVVVGLGLVVAVARRKADLDVDRLTALRN